MKSTPVLLPPRLLEELGEYATQQLRNRFIAHKHLGMEIRVYVEPIHFAAEAVWPVSSQTYLRWRFTCLQLDPITLNVLGDFSGLWRYVAQDENLLKLIREMQGECSRIYGLATLKDKTRK